MAGGRDVESVWDSGAAEVARSLRTPSAAALAGVAFAVLTLTVTVLMRLAVPAGSVASGDFVLTDRALALIRVASALVPFAGICFLWFIGVVRYRLGAREDRLFATVFIGSGLILIALMFVATSLLSALVLVAGSSTPLTLDTTAVALAFWDETLTAYATRMAGVFTFAATTLGLRTRVLPVWLAVVGYVAGVAMLVGPFGVHYVESVFPVWVGVMSVYALVRIRRGEVSV